MATAPTDQSSKKAIDDFNREMRSHPLYQEWFRARGLDPNKVKLSKEQRQQLEQMLVSNKIVPPEAFDDMMIDPAGNVNTEHGFASQPTWLKAIEIGGAAAAIAATGGAATGTLGFGGTTAPVAASTAAVAPAGVAGMVVPELGIGAIPGLLGSGVMPTMAGVGGAASTVGTLGKIGGMLGKAGPLLQGVGGAIGDAATASGNNQLLRNNLEAGANAQNISGEANFQNAQQGMAGIEGTQRESALKNLFRASQAKSGRVSPFNPVGPAKYSPEYLQGLSELEKQALTRLQQSPQYGTDVMRAPKPYDPYKPDTSPSTLQNVGNWLSPTLSTAALIGKSFLK